jgi:hypothetical protein
MSMVFLNRNGLSSVVMTDDADSELIELRGRLDADGNGTTSGPEGPNGGTP